MKNKKKAMAHLKAADCYIDLAAALIWTVEHLEHPICLDDRASPMSLGPDTAKTNSSHYQEGVQKRAVDSWLSTKNCTSHVLNQARESKNLK